MSILQELFTTAYRGLRSQGFQRSGHEGPRPSQFVCEYRSDAGMKCAVGWLIPDEEYDREQMEGLPVNSSVVGKLLIRLYGLDHKEMQALQFLQETHDSATSPDDMRERLAAFARKYSLTIPQD